MSRQRSHLSSSDPNRLLCARQLRPDHRRLTHIWHPVAGAALSGPLPIGFASCARELTARRPAAGPALGRKCQSRPPDRAGACPRPPDRAGACPRPPDRAGSGRAGACPRPPDRAARLPGARSAPAGRQRLDSGRGMTVHGRQGGGGEGRDAAVHDSRARSRHSARQRLSSSGAPLALPSSCLLLLGLAASPLRSELSLCDASSEGDLPHSGSVVRASSG